MPDTATAEASQDRQEVTDEHGAPQLEPAPGQTPRELPPGLQRGHASGAGNLCLPDALRQLLTEAVGQQLTQALAQGQPGLGARAAALLQALQTTGSFATWLWAHLPPGSRNAGS